MLYLNGFECWHYLNWDMMYNIQPPGPRQGGVVFLVCLLKSSL